MMRCAHWLYSILFVVLFGSVCLAADVPTLTGVFNDPQNIVSAEKRIEITAFLQQQEARTSNQIVVLVIPTLDGDDSVEYARRVFSAWQLGRKNYNNGVLVVIAKTDGDARIMVGNGLQGALTDIDCRHIIDDAWPLLKKGKIGSGLLQMVKAIDQKVGKEFAAPVAPNSVTTLDPLADASKDEDSGFPFFSTIAVLLVFGFVTWLIFFRRPRRQLPTSGLDDADVLDRRMQPGYSSGHAQSSSNPYGNGTKRHRHDDDPSGYRFHSCFYIPD